MNSRNLRVLKQMQNEEKHQLGLVKWTRVYSIASVIMGLATVVLLWVDLVLDLHCPRSTCSLGRSRCRTGSSK